MPLHPDKAARLMLFAQIGAVAAGALAVLAWVVRPTPPSPPEVQVAAPVVPGPKPARPDAPPPAHADWTEVAPMLAWATPPNTPETVAAGDKPGGPAKGPEDAGGAPGEPARPPFPLPSWRYVGYARQEGSLLALLSIDGKQHFVAPGQTIAGFRVDAVETSHIDVSLNGVLHTLNIIPPPQLDPHVAAPMFRETGPRAVNRPVRPPTPRPAGVAPTPNPAADRESALEQARQQSGERPQQ